MPRFRYSSVTIGITRPGILAAALLVCPFGFLHAAETLTPQQQEDFLAKAKTKYSKESKKGTTGTLRVTLTDGTLTHDASVQSIDEFKQFFLGEIGFKDSYKFNIAAWKVARLVGIADMIPPSVKRTYEGKTASFTWWIDNVKMDETDRRAKNVQAPDQEAWNEESNIMQVFDQLIYNVDRNQTNMLIDQGWHLWLIDHSRSFRTSAVLKDSSVVKACDRTMLAKMKALDKGTLTKELGRDVTKEEIKGLLARRDLIVKVLDSKGDSALFDRPKRN